MDGLEWPSSKKMVMGELIKGREFANKLQNMLQNPVQNNGSPVSSAQELVMKILRSFSGTLSVLSSDDHSDEVGHQISTVGYVGSACAVDRTPECAGESRKSPAAGKDRRGCYKRRKKSDTRIIVAPVTDDEYAWRKYGQKEILNAKFPRCYFRCTHKYDQGCIAVKQVQRMEDDSNMYHITYSGHHTCKNIVKPTQMFQEPLTNSYLLSFESKDHTNSRKRDHPYNCSTNVPTFAPLVKEEPKQLEQSTTELSDDNLSCADENLWKEIIALGSSENEPSIMDFDHDDVVSRVQYSGASTSSHGFDMEFLLKSVVQFDGEFPFGHSKDVLSIAFSIDNRQIVSASRDKSIKLWNTLGECKYTIQDGDAHLDWVSCIHFSPSILQPTIVSSSWDKTVKIWNLTNCKLKSTLVGHNGYATTVAVSPDGSLCASGGKDGVILLWDLAEGKWLYSLDDGSIYYSVFRS